MQEIYAEIRKTSKYASQIKASQLNGYAYPFQVHIAPDEDGYVVQGGYGGRYRLEDVYLFVMDGEGRKTYITK